MYKLKLCLRYLGTRWIALASIVSVCLGVATLIVVNAVMSGFSGHVKERVHGILADVMVESISSDGVEDPERLMALIEEAAGEHIAAMTPTVEIYGMMSFDLQGQSIPRPVTLVGILPDGKDLVSPIRQFLMSRTPPSEEAIVEQLGTFPDDAGLDWSLTPEALRFRETIIRWQQEYVAHAYEEPAAEPVQTAEVDNPFGTSSVADAGADSLVPENPFYDETASAEPDYSPAAARVYVGAGLISQPVPDGEGGSMTKLFLAPGQDVTLSTVKAGVPEPVRFRATVCDLFKSGYGEYDSSLVFCNLEELQAARGMLAVPPGEAPDWRQGAVTALQIRLKDYGDAPQVVEKIKRMLYEQPLVKGADPETSRRLYSALSVSTWEHKQAALLSAVAVETSILNVLLALIICVAGFGILAIFFMIVMEKTRDIGILKSLGASSGGVMSVFVGYGLALGLVGAGGGVVIGLLFVAYINQIEDGISYLAGTKVFDETIYYFSEIPTEVSPLTVTVVAIGAVTVAVLASLLPAMRAARLHPVRALRWE